MRPSSSQALPARPRRGRETRAAIMAAAERIFAEAGPAGARTEAIAANAGVNKALLYYYFPSKDALFRAVLEAHLKEFCRQGMAVLSAGGSTRSTLLRYVSMHFDFISARPFYPSLFLRLAMTGERHLGGMARKYFGPLSQKLVGVIERGARRGELRRTDGLHTAISLVALTVYYFAAAPVLKAVVRFNPYEASNLARRKKEVLDFIRHGLFREPEARIS